ncbi:MAG: FAD-binding and (Fe-S)-binding domain-containing protein [Gammaproteobacteria bacterium]
MLPNISPEFTLTQIYQDYLGDLSKIAPNLDIRTDYAARLAVATDNSIYQVIPQAVIFPKSTTDISKLLELASQQKYHKIKFCPRGGGTSTNGQSLSAGIIIDCSKHMREILELNLEEQWVRVQPGVVLDQLNAYLKPMGVSFATEISPSNRATIGGMINTDASGTGSRLLGRTSDHVIDLTCILNTGRVIHSRELYDNNPLYREIINLIRPQQQLIEEKFTSAPRTLNGYNLKKALTHLNYLFCGAEGTLAIISECKLKLTPLPKYKKLLVVKYRAFDDALRAVEMQKEIIPLAIEAIDEKLIDLARKDSLYFHIKDFIDGENTQTGAINLVEFVAEDDAILEKQVTKFCENITSHRHLPQHAIGYYIAKNPTEIKLLWELRKKSVGLISKECDGTRRPIPFVEDTAVPPEKLADYINEFKALLDHYQLDYGMYGHVDAGCVHVRPALDMKLAQDESLMRELSDKVVALLEKYDGVLWGEHGQGHRTQYSERFFGKELYLTVRKIKTLFDPHNQLNPGKIATALDSSQTLASLEGPLRGQYDKQISANIRDEFASAMICNGNGACFNYATADVMCPSYKVTKDRIHSPKGRATLMREWLRALSVQSFTLDINKHGNFFKKLWNHFNKKPDFSHDVNAAFSGCLACKACASQCPLNVDVPEFKAKFLASYYQRYLRSPRDYLIGFVENVTQFQAKMPKFSNLLIRQPWFQRIVRRLFKMTALPQLGLLSIKQELIKRNAPIFNLDDLKNLTIEQKSKSVILLQDTFTSFYEPEVFLDIFDVLTKLGYSVYVAPFFINGKSLHVRGFLTQFSERVKKNMRRLQAFSELDIPIVGIDPSITLTYRDEYQKVIRNDHVRVLLLQEWLTKSTPANLPTIQNQENYYLISHCTEKTMCVEAEKQWQQFFKLFGFNLTPIAAGCCGMAGSYGHEVEHVENSRSLFNMDWKQHLAENKGTILVTGYSCRSQSSRFMGVKLQHPLQVLIRYLN